LYFNVSKSKTFSFLVFFFSFLLPNIQTASNLTVTGHHLFSATKRAQHAGQQVLHLHAMEPTTIIELQGLTNAANAKKYEGNLAASIPYLGKIVHLLDTQTSRQRSAQDISMAQTLEHMAAEARIDFANALFQTQQYAECEVQTGLVCKFFERYLKKPDLNQSERNGIQSKLLAEYDAWADCYENLGNSFLADKIRKRKEKLLAK
jgi:hypothetical protein